MAALAIAGVVVRARWAAMVSAATWLLVGAVGIPAFSWPGNTAVLQAYAVGVVAIRGAGTALAWSTARATLGSLRPSGPERSRRR